MICRNVLFRLIKHFDEKKNKNITTFWDKYTIFLISLTIFHCFYKKWKAIILKTKNVRSLFRFFYLSVITTFYEEINLKMNSNSNNHTIEVDYWWV